MRFLSTSCGGDRATVEEGVPDSIILRNECDDFLSYPRPVFLLNASYQLIGTEAKQDSVLVHTI